MKIGKSGKKLRTKEKCRRRCVLARMNYINNGKYYLIAKYDEEVHTISINQKWYLGNKTQDNFQTGNDISAIDIITTKFENEKQMKEQMLGNVKVCLQSLN